jgi:hypothetical protein
VWNGKSEKDTFIDRLVHTVVIQPIIAVVVQCDGQPRASLSFPPPPPQSVSLSLFILVSVFISLFLFQISIADR